MPVTLEICVDSPQGLIEAIVGGADRIELCAALALGGLTPSPGLLAQASRVEVPVVAMIRPREGDFCWSPAEVRAMCDDIAAARAAGLAGVVIGASNPDGTLDEDALITLLDAAKGLSVTLHRAFDLCPDPEAALETAIFLGFDRILTSAGKPRVVDGIDLLSRLFAQAAGRIALMPGSGVTPETLPALAGLPLTDLHASCAVDIAVPAQVAAMGFSTPARRQTRASTVGLLRRALDDLSAKD